MKNKQFMAQNTSVGETGMRKTLRVGETGVGKMAVGKMGVGETGVGEMGITHFSIVEAYKKIALVQKK